MILSANEARRLMKTRWQTELFILDYKIKEAIYQGKNQLVLDSMLYNTTIEYLKNQGYSVIVRLSDVIINWE